MVSEKGLAEYHRCNCCNEYYVVFYYTCKNCRSMLDRDTIYHRCTSCGEFHVMGSDEGCQVEPGALKLPGKEKENEPTLPTEQRLRR